MCDRFSAALEAAAGTLCDCVKDICGRELPVRVWARGMSVRSNAALLLSGAMKQTLSACAALVLKAIKRNEKELTDWYATADGFLECAFAVDFVLSAAHDFFSQARAIPVNDSHEKLFFEKCTLLRAESVLLPPKKTAELSQAQLDAAADAMRRAEGERTPGPEIARTARLLEARLDRLMPRTTRDDLYAGALFGALSRMIHKEDER